MSSLTLNWMFHLSTAGDDVSVPDTGDNDVVGIAVALTVVSLISAGVMTMKK